MVGKVVSALVRISTVAPKSTGSLKKKEVSFKNTLDEAVKISHFNKPELLSIQPLIILCNAMRKRLVEALPRAQV